MTLDKSVDYAGLCKFGFKHDLVRAVIVTLLRDKEAKNFGQGSDRIC